MFSTNVYFLMWLIIDINITSRELIRGLDFTSFFLMANAGLLTVSLVSVSYVKLGDLLTDNGFRSIQLFLFKTVISVAIFYSVVMLAAAVHFALIAVPETSNIRDTLLSFTTSPYLTALLVFFSFTCMLMFFISNLERRSGNISKLFSQSMGEVIRPTLVHKGFMFIDLNYATRLAETLDSKTYANLLHDCFAKLEELVSVTPFEIYQYVGDEAVITWDTGLYKSDLLALQLFSDFRELLMENAAYYKASYRTVPVFKCAIHIGEVVQSEIGKDKKHLAYHGDTLNTSSRLLGECHKQMTDLIISKDAVSNKALIDEKFYLTLIKFTKLKGKREVILAFTVAPRTHNKSIHCKTPQETFFLLQPMTNGHYSNFNFKNYET